MIKDYKIKTGTANDNDPVVINEIDGALPFLYLTDDFVDQHLLKSETITNKENDSKPYDKEYEDENDGDERFMLFARVKDVANETNTIYYDKNLKSIFSGNIYADVDASLCNAMKFRQVSKLFNPIATQIPNDTLSLSSYNGIYKLPTPTKTLDRIKVVHLAIDGVQTASRVKRIRFDSDPTFYREINVLSLMKIKLSDIGWDKADIKVFTLVTVRPRMVVLRSLGIKHPEYIYIPLP